MNALESLFQLLSGFASAAAEAVWNVVLAPVFDDAVYRQGFIWGFLTAGVVGFFFTAVRFYWNQILQFFSPSRVPPPPGRGPSPAEQWGGCAVSSCLLLVLVAGSLVFGVSLLALAR